MLQFLTNYNLYMNKQLLEKLKQAYSHLGLAENVLQMHADSLIATGFVTAENMDEIVTKQKDFLEGLQKYNDTRVSDAVKKASEKALKDAEEKAKKEAEEAAKKAREEALKNLPDSVKAAIESLKAENLAEKEASAAKRLAEEEERKKHDDETKALIAKMQEQLNGFKQENDKLKAEQVLKARKDAIVAKAKELGIPQYRIDEGFVINDDATEEQYTQYLSNIAKNIKANQLPGRVGHMMPTEKEVSKEEVENIAKSMVNNL